MKTATIALSAVLTCISLAFAQPQQAQPQQAAPAAAPAETTQPAPPRKVEIPPGFKTVTVNGRNVLCEEVDEGWVTTALSKIAAATRPATLPVTMLERLTAQRDALLRQIAVDLALTDLKEAARIYDVELVGEIRKLDQYRPPIFYLVSSPERLAELMRAGWSDPHFYYNRAADAVTFNPAGVLTAERPQDEALFPAAYDPKDDPDKRQQALTLTIGSIEASIAASIDIRSRQHVGATFALLVQQVGFEPLDLKEDQAWFTVGVATVLSAGYASTITGESRQELLDMLSFDHPANPLKTTVIDLIHPQNVADMREEALPAYFDAVRRKSTRVTRLLIEQGGEQAIPKSIAAIREKKPADGAALVQVIRDATGVDLSTVVVRGG